MISMFALKEKNLIGDLYKPSSRYTSKRQCWILFIGHQIGLPCSIF